MSFIKFETVYSTKSTTEENQWEYRIGNTIILNPDYIVEIKKFSTNPKLSPETAKEFSKIYDVPTSELYLFEITLSNKNTEFVIMPEKIFKNFVK